MPVQFHNDFIFNFQQDINKQIVFNYYYFKELEILLLAGTFILKIQIYWLILLVVTYSLHR